MIRFRHCSLILLLCLAGVAKGQTTWTNTIASIVYNHCTTCHRANSIAPFPLEHYSDFVANATSIAHDVSSHVMPPWPPDPGYTRLAHERLLSAQQITDLVNFVNNGMPPGDTTQAPPVPVFTNGSQIGVPDLVKWTPSFTVTQNTDQFRCFVIPSGFASTQNLSAMEFIPTNRSIVHHVLVFWDTTGYCQQLDANDPGPGYDGFGGVGSPQAQLIGAWVPGASPFVLPSAFGIPIPAHADIVVQFHYAPGSLGQTDSSRLNLFYNNNSLARPVYFAPVLNHAANMTDGPLFIPANQIRTFHEAYQLPNANVSVLGVAPHMHLIGTSINSYGVTPAGDTIPFISIPDWKFHWQGAYNFRSILKVPAGSHLYAAATYDNTSNNDENPSNPPLDVSVGEGTLNEMMIVFYQYTLYLPGDENVVLDTSALVDLSTDIPATAPDAFGLQVFPNPGLQAVIADFNLPSGGNYSLNAYDLMGRKVYSFFNGRTMEAGHYRFQYSCGGLSSGIYFMQLEGAGEKTQMRFVKQ